MVDTTVEDEVEVAVDTGVGTIVDGDAEEADQPRRWSARSVRRKDAQEKPKVLLRRSKRKAVEKPDVDKHPWKTGVKSLHSGRSPWYAVEVDIAKSTIFIYNPDRNFSTDDKIRADLKPMTMILLMVLKKINIVIVALAIEQITTTSKQSNS
ncbi:hypothetical protein Fot_06424 [Forsythia ovata]|uniref:Uncharacterized protein n=1 Tax=Forsythia ovata TaxID=205694 RepID=A0ABD1WTI8_9LAMI